MNLLFLADPNSIHDIKWVSFFSERYNCFLIARKSHLSSWTERDVDDFQQTYRVTIIGSVEDFSIRRFSRTYREAMKLNRWFRKYRINIFHILYAEPNALWSNFRQVADVEVKWILTTRGTDILKTIPEHFSKKDVLNRLVSFLYKRALKNYDHITTTSNGQVKNVQRIAATSRVQIIRTGVDIDSIMQDAGDFIPASLTGKKYVLFPRNMRPIYNHEFSLKAISLLPRDIIEQYSFVFVDKDSSDANYVERCIELMRSDGAIDFIFLERQSQQAIWQLYKNSSLVVMNPLSDGTPVSAMEAMLCRAPLILGNLPYDEDIFGDVTLILSSWDPNELAAKMTSVLSGKIHMPVNEAYNRIVEKGNRRIEMNKLQLVYDKFEF
jgi:hypothetical protein